MGAVGTPIMKTVAVTATGVVMDFGQQVSAVTIRNDGPSTVYFAEGTTFPTPTRGDGRYALEPGEFINLADLSAYKLAFICAVAGTATVQSVAVPGCYVQLSTSGGIFNLIDLSSFSTIAVTTVAPVVSGPKVFAIPLASYGGLDLSSLLNNVLADIMSVSQGTSAADVGNLVTLIEAELDNSGVYYEVFKLYLAVTGTGGSGGGTKGADYQVRKTRDVADLKLLGSTITRIRATSTLTKTGGTGTMTAAVNFTNIALSIYSGVKGANYA